MLTVTDNHELQQILDSLSHMDNVVAHFRTRWVGAEEGKPQLVVRINAPNGAEFYPIPLASEYTLQCARAALNAARRATS